MANENKYYKLPFAESGNFDDVPDQASGGYVDYESGYGTDYEKAEGVEGRKRIERTTHNGILYAITKNVKQWQERSFPTWIEDDGSADPAEPFGYSIGAIVNHNDVNWTSIEGNNTDEPSAASSKWDYFESSRKAIINTVHYIGATMLTFEGTSPQVKYPWQTWQLISGDASIRLGDGSSQSTVSQGNNTPSVPLVSHAHSMNHDHPATTTSANGNHNHSINYNAAINDGGGNLAGYSQVSTAYSKNTGDAGNHQHTVDIPNYVGNTGSTGQSSPTLDVRGAYVKMNLWLRTA